MIPDDTPMVCLECQALVRMDFVAAHMRWHEIEKANQQLIQVHVENLIERMHTAEKQIEACVARLYLLERGRMGLPPGGDPQGHHHQAY